MCQGADPALILPLASETQRPNQDMDSMDMSSMNISSMAPEPSYSSSHSLESNEGHHGETCEVHLCLYLLSRHGLYQTGLCQQTLDPIGSTILPDRYYRPRISNGIVAAGMGMMMMMQMYFTATTHVTLWFQRWHTNSSAWCHPPLSSFHDSILPLLVALCQK